MATYVTLYQFTEQGIENVKDSPERLRKGIEAAQDAGGTLLAAYYIEGPYDLITIAEWPDEKAATAFQLAIGAQGNVRSTTMRGYSPEAFEEIVGVMP